MNDVTRILSAIEQGDPMAAGQLLPLVYDELLKLAARKLAREQPGQTLQGHGPRPRGLLTAGRRRRGDELRAVAATCSRCAALISFMADLTFSSGYDIRHEHVHDFIPKARHIGIQFVFHRAPRCSTGWRIPHRASCPERGPESPVPRKI